MAERARPVNALVVILSNGRYVAVLSLLAALLANWLLGTLDALVRHQFSWQAWPRIISSQLASRELTVIYATYGGGVGAAVAAYFLERGGIIDRTFMVFTVSRLLDVAAAAAALYSVALWHECTLQVSDVWAGLSTGPNTPRRNVPRGVAQAPRLA